MTQAAAFTRQELMIAVIARLLEGCRLVATGASSPIPGAGALLARAQSGGRLRVNVLGSIRNDFLCDGGVELFDLAGQGRLDAFFLGGGQIDGQANLNLIGTGDWPGTGARFPGSFGSAFMYLMTPRTILFREEHSPRVLVPKVDNNSAPGISPPGVFRRGTAQALVTGKCVFTFDGAKFNLDSLHQGETEASIRDATGFDYASHAPTPITADPTEAELALLRGPVCDEMLATYPEFCRRVWGRETSDRNAA